ncbi:MAG: hypothetical protein ACRDPO_10320 [Streptosporangiaceae bacterium]
MTREKWIRYHLARAPRITARQWAQTLLLLEPASHDDDPEDAPGDEQEEIG